MRTTKKTGTGKTARLRQEGFSLIEVMVSIAVLTIGLLALLGALGFAMANTQTAQQALIAKQLAQQAMESIYTARDTANITWCQLQSPGPVCPSPANPPTGIFVTGFQPINQAGADGIIGTADDSAAGPQTLTSAGPDGILGTADDITTNLSGFSRSITFSTVDPSSGAALPPDMRVVTITIQYTTPQLKIPKVYVLTGYISQYR
jgi:prepilin-type N-terminal cleavage/methylation domain-containing protein